MRKDYGTLEDKRVLFDLVLESMENGQGLSFAKSCRHNGITYPSSALGWLPELGSEIQERYARTQLVSIDDYDDMTEEMLVGAIKNPQMSDSGIDLGYVGLVREMCNVRSSRNNARKSALKAREESNQKPMDIGAITVNLIQDTRPKE